MYRTCLGFRTQTCERIHHQSARLTVIDRYSKQTDISNHSLALSTPRFRMQSSQARRMKESQLLLPKEGDSPQRHCVRQGAHQGEHHLKAHTHTHSDRGLDFEVRVEVWDSRSSRGMRGSPSRLPALRLVRATSWCE